MKRHLIFGLLIAGILAATASLPPVEAQVQVSDRPFSLTNAPAAGSAATATKAAVTGVKHVPDCVAAEFTGNASLAAAAAGTLVIRDGATGVGTIVYQVPFTVGAAPGNTAHFLLCPVGGLALPTTAGNALTVEFTAGATNVLESVYLKGHDER